MSTADDVLLHAPATPEKEGMIGESALRSMKPTTYVVNTPRAVLVDEGALPLASRSR